MPLKPPYTSEWGKLGRFTVWLVDGEAVRRKTIEFTDFDQHFHCRVIPRNEIWVDDASDPHEIPFFAKMAVREATMMANGATYAKAEGIASRIDTALRKHDPVNHARVQIAKLGDNGRINVWLVKGDAVRDLFDDEFTLGGHWLIYPWVPRGEIWLDDATKPADRPYDFLHELYEVNRMSRGIAYPEAHHESSAVELRARNHPDEYRSLLEGQEVLAGGSFGLERIAEFRSLLAPRR
jgi:hypothetical protein